MLVFQEDTDGMRPNTFALRRETVKWIQCENTATPKKLLLNMLQKHFSNCKRKEG